MKLNDKQIQFLNKVESFSTKYNSIKIGDQVESLFHCFWSRSEIEQSENIKDEWSVEDVLIPFYGDWHDLICLNTQDNSVIYLNDDRDIICKWESSNAFENSLEFIEEAKQEKDLGIVSVSGSFFDD